ncbi:helix-turn-helix domain-containing protein [Nisaea sp.]|uniref:helix-turn-helix transcriptional regulator n=1 Tax=Nisaea sp. TaxID=2024842 RepID=UPI003299994C
MPEYLSPKAVSRLIGKSDRTLKRWRAEGKGPPWTRNGEWTVAYPGDGLQVWLATRIGLPAPSRARHDPHGDLFGPTGHPAAVLRLVARARHVSRIAA